MTITAIRKKLINYLADADNKIVKALYTILEDKIDQEEIFKLTDKHMETLDERKAILPPRKDKSSARGKKIWTNNKDYIAEMNSRHTEVKTGKVKGLSLDELETRTRKTYKNMKRKRP